MPIAGVKPKFYPVKHQKNCPKATDLRTVFTEGTCRFEGRGRWAVLCVAELTDPSAFHSCLLKKKKKKSEDNKSGRWNEMPHMMF